MKTILKRILAVLLIAMMLIPTLATFAVNAEETDEAIDISDIVNVFKVKKTDAAPNMEKVAGAKDAEPTYEEGMVASEPFEVTHASDGDRYIYVGPCPDPRINYGKAIDYIAYWYNKDGRYGSQKSFMELGNSDVSGTAFPNIVGEFSDGSVILKIRAGKLGSSYAKYAALKLPIANSQFVLATVERPFTVEEYYAYADAQGWELSGTSLRPAPPEIAEEAPDSYEGLWNYFPLAEDLVAPSTQNEAENVYVKSKYIPVVEGDTIMMGAVSTKEAQNILFAYSNEAVIGTNSDGPVTFEYKEVKKYKKSDVGIEFIENIGYNYASYSYTVPEGVSYVKVSAPISVYANGDILVTKNQEFNSVQFRQALEVPELSNEAKNHDFNGKNALFVGDSILYGEYDTPASFRTPSTSFVRRLALATGLIPTNNAAQGATIGKTGRTNVKWGYDLLKTALMSTKKYDMVIFQGGINDARQNVSIGEMLPVETDREILKEKDRIATFAGGLQLMFNDARDKWPEAKLYYIASYKTIPEAANGKDMSLYYAQAKALCEAYCVHYIDLYNDVELYKTFDYENAELFADDKFTPTKETYDLLFPTVLRLFEGTSVCVGHIYDNNCDESCNYCGYIRETEHIYDNNCDAECNECGNIRTVAHKTSIFRDDKYHWFGCEYCDEISDREEHVYDSQYDTICNICGEERIVESTPEETLPEESTTEITAPEEDVPEESSPEASTPEETTPEATTPEESTSDEIAPEVGEDTEEEHVCEEVSGWKAFWNAIANFFRRLFGQPEICTCGEIIEKKK